MHTSSVNSPLLGKAPNGAKCRELTLVDFFTESALLSLLEVLAALGELRPLDRMSSLMGEALPSGLVGCFLRPLRSVDICWFKTEFRQKDKAAFKGFTSLFPPSPRSSFSTDSKGYCRKRKLPKCAQQMERYATNRQYPTP